MRARAVELGRDHWLRVRLRRVAPIPGRLASDGHGGRGFPAIVTRRRVTVVDRAPTTGRYGAVVVEADRMVCVNAHWFTGPGEVTQAQMSGRLRWRRERRRWTVPVRELIGPTPAAERPAGVEGAGQNGRTGMAS